MAALVHNAGPAPSARSDRRRTAQEGDVPRIEAAVPGALRELAQWLVWRHESRPGEAKPRKVPYYVGSGARRHGTQGADEDRAQLADFDEALLKFAGGGWNGIGFAFLPGDNIVGLDFDDCIDEHGTIEGEVLELTAGTFRERSQSGRGVHAFYRGELAVQKAGAGQAGGIEIFCGSGYIAFTGDSIDSPSLETAELDDRVRGLVARRVERVQGPPPPSQRAAGAGVHVSLETVAELRSALAWLSSDERDEWVAVAHALHELGDVGRGLWEEWSQKSEKYDAAAAARVWGSVRETPRTGYAAVIARAQRKGWLNPASRAAREFTGGDEPPRAAGAFALAPLDILRPLTAPPLLADDVPPVLGRFADAFARASGFDVSIMLAAGIGAACAMLSDQVRVAVQPRSSWFESARLWIAIVGGPGAGKSPGTKAALAPVFELHRELIAKWRKEHAEAKDAPPMPLLYVTDATTEALADALKGSSRGLLYWADELEAWLGQHDAYRSGAGKDRGEWLRLYDGGPHQVNRVTRGAFFVENWGVSLISATTPAALRKLAPKLPDDGLIQRVLLVSASQLREPDAAMLRTETTGPRDAWALTLRALHDRPACTVRLSSEARAAHEKESTEMRRVCAAFEDSHPALASHIAKRPGMLARLALVFHAIENAHAFELGDVSPEAMTMAIRFLRRQERHAFAAFDVLAQADTGMALARDIARSILASELHEFQRGDLSHACRRFRDAGEPARQAALTVLADCGWIAPQSRLTPFAYGGSWTVNPAAHEHYAEQGAAMRARREYVRERFRGDR